MFSKKAVLSSIILVLILLFLCFVFFKTESKTPTSTDTSPAASSNDQSNSLRLLSEISDTIAETKSPLDFPQALKIHAQQVFSDSVLADVDPDGAIQFTNEKLVLDLQLRQRLDAYLLLYPDLSLEGIGYLLSKDEAFSASQKNADQRFEQLDKVLNSYFELQTALQNKPLTKPTEVDFNKIIDQLSDIRKEIMGEELAEAFFAEEEDFVRSKIPNQALNFSEIERQAQEAADIRALELEQQDNN